MPETVVFTITCFLKTFFSICVYSNILIICSCMRQVSKIYLLLFSEYYQQLSFRYLLCGYLFVVITGLHAYTADIVT